MLRIVIMQPHADKPRTVHFRHATGSPHRTAKLSVTIFAELNGVWSKTRRPANFIEI